MRIVSNIGEPQYLPSTVQAHGVTAYTHLLPELADFLHPV